LASLMDRLRSASDGPPDELLAPATDPLERFFRALVCARLCIDLARPVNFDILLC